VTLSVFDAAREVPLGVALSMGGAEVTFSELAARVERRWSRIRDRLPRETPPWGALVALLGASDRPSLETVYTLMTAGAPVALIHPRLTPEERVATVDILRPKLLLGVGDARFDDAAGGAPGERDPALESPLDDSLCLAVLMTSGTTGRPKGVVLSRGAFIASARASERNLPLAPGDRWLLGLPIAHVGGLSILTRCLLSRAAVVVPREVAEGLRLDAAALIRTIAQERVTHVSLVPTQLEWLVSAEPSWVPPTHLRAILLGGAAARPSLLARAADRGLPVLTTYGLTEACSQVTTQVAGTVNRGQLGSGRPMPGVEVRLRDGLIEVRGPTLFDRYIPAYEPPSGDDGFFSTSDVGRFDDEGNLHVTGRRSELVITGGENVHPAEVEAVVEQCPGVTAACVFGVPDDTWGEVLAVAIVAPESEAVTDTALGDFLRERLAAHRRPRFVARLEALAVTPAGKLDRTATRGSAEPLLRPL
jgi:O-succinylbenzoic acid--CoA ligase